LPALFALPHLSVRDIFWAGSTGTLGHSYLRNSLFLVVNRRSKRPATSLSSPVWAQPLYIVETREGGRVCGACSLDDGTILLRPGTKGMLRLRNHVDAEVVGKVMAIVRHLDASG